MAADLVQVLERVVLRHQLAATLQELELATVTPAVSLAAKARLIARGARQCRLLVRASGAWRAGWKR
jgi:hypothetical protein